MASNNADCVAKCSGIYSGISEAGLGPVVPTAIWRLRFCDGAHGLSPVVPTEL